jgi:DNA-binding MarR family transcriptional regulator
VTDEALLRFSAAVQSDIAALLMGASRTVNREALAALDPESTSGVRAAHLPLIAALEPGGARLVTLAARIGITRQAVAALARDLTAAGITDMVDDPHDGRAQLVVLTDAGADLCARAATYLERREAQLRERYGDDTLAIVREVLEGLANGD